MFSLFCDGVMLTPEMLDQAFGQCDHEWYSFLSAPSAGFGWWRRDVAPAPARIAPPPLRGVLHVQT